MIWEIMEKLKIGGEVFLLKFVILFYYYNIIYKYK